MPPLGGQNFGRRRANNASTDEPVGRKNAKATKQFQATHEIVMCPQILQVCWACCHNHKSEGRVRKTQEHQQRRAHARFGSRCALLKECPTNARKNRRFPSFHATGSRRLFKSFRFLLASPVNATNRQILPGCCGSLKIQGETTVIRIRR